jgi:hypothetical protein
MRETDKATKHLGVVFDAYFKAEFPSLTQVQ